MEGSGAGGGGAIRAWLFHYAWHPVNNHQQMYPESGGEGLEKWARTGLKASPPAGQPACASRKAPVQTEAISVRFFINYRPGFEDHYFQQ